MARENVMMYDPRRGGNNPLWAEVESMFLEDFFGKEGVIELPERRFKEMHHSGGISASLISGAISPEVAETLAMIYYPPYDRGVIKGPHVHCRGKVYLLNKKQWASFSQRTVAEFSKKLSEARAVNFEQVMELANTMNGII